ncbi:MAG: aminotransferase class III-fold pyridoxal phosphate-dependent enzyme [bacterium]
MKLWRPGRHRRIFSQPVAVRVSCAAALATIKVIEEENLLQQSQQLGTKAMSYFKQLQEQYPIIGDVRGKGLSIGVDLVRDPETKERATTETAKVCYRAWEKGLLLAFFSQSVLRIQPPLVLKDAELDRALAIIEESLADVMAGKVPDAVLEQLRAGSIL